MAIQHKMDYSRLVNTIENLKGCHSDTSKVADFFIAYVCGSTYKQAAEISGVNLSTAKSWQQNEWFGEVMEVARAVAGQKVDRKLSGIIDLALGNLKERLVKGDPFKNGANVDYKPVTARDSALIAAICYDKRALSRGEPTNIAADMPIEERLKSLGETFSEIAQGKPALKVVDK